MIESYAGCISWRSKNFLDVRENKKKQKDIKVLIGFGNGNGNGNGSI